MLIDVAITLMMPIIIGFFLGLYIDKLLSTTPLIAIIMSILGIFAGFYIVYKRYTK